MPAIPGRAQCIVSDRTQNYVWISMRMLVVVCHYFVIFEDFGRGILLEIGFSLHPSSTAKWMDPTNLLFIIFIMHCFTAIRQSFWCFYIVNYQQIYRDAFAIPIVNFLLEFYSGTLPALILQNQQHLNTFQWIGVVLFVLGGFMETTYELTRKSFKADPKNQGLPYISGMATFVQHPNYFGYILFRGSYAIVTKNLFSFLVVPFLMIDFITGGIPDLQSHNRRKYGSIFEEYSRKTKKLIPYVW